MNNKKTDKQAYKNFKKNTLLNFNEIVKGLDDAGKCVFYFLCICLYSHEEIIKNILSKFFKEKIDKDTNVRVKMMQILVNTNHMDYNENLHNAIQFIHNHIYPSIKYFKISKNDTYHMVNLLSHILDMTFCSNKIYIWDYHYIYEVIFKNGIFTEENTIIKKFKTTITNNTHFVIEDFNKKIRYDKFTYFHLNSRLSDEERYFSFYRDVASVISPKKETYCGICRPYGEKPTNQKTGKTVTSHPCNECNIIFNSIYNLLNHEEKAVGRIKDNITKIHYNANDDSYIDKRIKAFERSFDREIKKQHLDINSLENNLSEEDAKKISEKINSIKKAMKKRIKPESPKI